MGSAFDSVAWPWARVLVRACVVVFAVCGRWLVWVLCVCVRVRGCACGRCVFCACLLVWVGAGLFRYVARHQKLRAAWQPVWGPPPPPPPVPHASSASLFQEGESAGEELHMVALWHMEEEHQGVAGRSVGE